MAKDTEKPKLVPVMVHLSADIIEAVDDFRDRQEAQLSGPPPSSC